MAYVTDARIDDGPRISNVAQDGKVYIYDEANDSQLVLSKRDIEFIDPAFEKALALLIKDLIVLPVVFDFPTDAEIEAKKTEDWIPPKLRMECDEMAESRIRLSLLHGNAIVEGSTICFAHTNGIITMEAMMYQMRHEPSPNPQPVQTIIQSHGSQDNSNGVDAASNDSFWENALNGINIDI